MIAKARILVVEDEPRYVRAIRINLEASGYEVITANNGKEALEQIAQNQLDLVLLDLMLPEVDGYAVCQRVREFSDIPIIMLTALADTEYMVRGLDCGADDYVTKPFSVKELMARVRVALRRKPCLGNEPEASFTTLDGNVRVDFAERRVFVAGEEVLLTLTEYRLLSALVQNVNRVLVSNRLLENIWGAGHENDNHLLWQAIHRLRQKIKDDEEPKYVQTRPGIGYIFTCEE